MLLGDSIIDSTANSESSWVSDISGEQLAGVELFVTTLHVSGCDNAPSKKCSCGFATMFGDNDAEVLFGGWSQALQDEMVA